MYFHQVDGHINETNECWSYLPIGTLSHTHKTIYDLFLIIVMLYTIYLPQITIQDKTLKYLMVRIEEFQHQAALAITGAWKDSYRTSLLYEELEWETFLIDPR